MTLVLLCDYYHPFEIGGAERSAERLAIELGRRGVRVIVVTPNFGAAPREHLHGVEVIRLPFPQRLTPGALARRFWMANPALHLWYALQIALIARRSGAALIHVQNSPLIVCGWLAARTSGVRLVVTIRDLGYVEPESAAPVPSMKAWLDSGWAWMERRARRAAVKAADAVIFVSEALRSVYASRGQERIAASGRVVHNIAPPPSALDLPREPADVLYVGKLSTGKGLHVLYDAARLLVSRVPHVRFVIVGRPGTGFVDPPADIRHTFDLRGRLPAGDVQRLMARATVLVVPSIWPEPLSRVILEGMSEGVPVVATEAGGTREAIEHDVSGWIVPPGDPAALAGGIERILTDANLARRLATTARTTYGQKFGPDRIVPEMLRIYEEARARA